MLRQVFEVFDTKKNDVIGFDEFVIAVSVFHPNAPLQEKADCEYTLLSVHIHMSETAPGVIFSNSDILTDISLQASRLIRSCQSGRPVFSQACDRGFVIAKAPALSCSCLPDVRPGQYWVH